MGHRWPCMATHGISIRVATSSWCFMPVYWPEQTVHKKMRRPSEDFSRFQIRTIILLWSIWSANLKMRARVFLPEGFFPGYVTEFSDSECCVCGSAVGLQKTRECVWFEWSDVIGGYEEHRSKVSNSKCNYISLTESCPNSGDCRKFDLN